MGSVEVDDVSLGTLQRHAETGAAAQPLRSESCSYDIGLGRELSINRLRGGDASSGYMKSLDLCIPDNRWAMALGRCKGCPDEFLGATLGLVRAMNGACHFSQSGFKGPCFIGRPYLFPDVVGQHIPDGLVELFPVRNTSMEPFLWNPVSKPVLAYWECRLRLRWASSCNRLVRIRAFRGCDAAVKRCQPRQKAEVWVHIEGATRREHVPQHG